MTDYEIDEIKQKYRIKAKLCDIRVGDFVCVHRKVNESDAVWWCIDWCLNMDKTVGMVGQVSAINTDWIFRVNFGSDYWYCYPYMVLKKTTSRLSKFSVGDFVLVTRVWEYGEYGTNVGFVRRSDMSKTIGEIGQIQNVELSSSYGFVYDIQFENYGMWSYPEFVLRNISTDSF